MILVVDLNCKNFKYSNYNDQLKMTTTNADFQAQSPLSSQSRASCTSICVLQSALQSYLITSKKES